MSEGYTGCCESGNCLGGELSSCYCDELCHRLGDCCDDILDIACPAPGRTRVFSSVSTAVDLTLCEATK